MVVGVDDAAAVIGIVAFSAQLFQTCMKGLLTLSKARAYGSDVSGTSLMFELQLHKLYTWAEEVGLLHEPKQLLVNQQYASVVPKVLGHLKDLCLDLDKLKKYHRLELEETTQELLTLGEEETAFERLAIIAPDGCEDFIKRMFKRRDKA
jgi:hypothetical protein